MNSNLLLSLFLGTTASLAMNVGKGIQKWKVDVLKHKTSVLQNRHRKDFIVWLLGALLTASSAPLYSLAFKYSDQPSLITSLGGIGLIGVLIFSVLVLKEAITSKKLIGAGLIIFATILINYFNNSASKQIIQLNSFFPLLLSYLIGLTLVFYISHRLQQIAGKLYSVIAGVLLGTSMILADIALVSSAGDLWRQFHEIYVYIAIMTALGAFVVTQLALMREQGSVVIPIIHSTVILISVILEFIIFSASLTPIQLIGVLIIIIGVFFLTSDQKILLT
jgi:drug/metabolite transporter (DMT)-like permease